MIAKRLGLPYLPGSREGVAKVKEHKTADCVVIGVRWKVEGEKLATLLLGLYRDDGGIDYVGSAAVGAKTHDDVLGRVQPLLDSAFDRPFSEPNRWGGGELAQSALRPELVVEVRYDKVQGNRFRHGTRLLRFRPDKDAEQCTWRELRPERRPDDPSVEALLALSGERSFFARDGCTRLGSPGIFGKFGGYGASPTPSASSRSTHSSSTPRSFTASSIPACTSPSSAKRACIETSVKSSLSTSGSSSHVTGADTGACGNGRTEYALAIVRSRAFWL